MKENIYSNQKYKKKGITEICLEFLEFDKNDELLKIYIYIGFYAYG
jgi:hypothetical protein